MSNSEQMQTDMTGKIEEVKDLVRSTPDQIPPFLWGPPGIGKTDLVGQLADEREARLIVLKASELRPEDLAGVPFPYEEGWTQFHPIKPLLELTQEWPELKRQHFEKKKQERIDEERKRLRAEHRDELALIEDPADRAERREELDAEFEARMEELDAELEEQWEPVETDEEVFLFLDEFSNAPSDMVAPFQYLVLNRKVGGVNGYTLRDNVRIIAAGNREQDRAGTHELTSPLKSRFMHVEVKPDVEEWAAWARQNNVHPHVIAFVRARTKNFHDFDPKSKAKTYPCPRNWTFLSESLKHLEENVDLAGERGRKVRRLQAEGLVGPGAASEFVSFVELALEMPTADDIIADPEGTPKFKDDPDRAMVALENLIAASRREPETYIDPAIEYVSEMHAEYQTIFYTTILNLHGDMDGRVIDAAIESENWEKIQQNLTKVADLMDVAEDKERGGEDRSNLSI